MAAAAVGTALMTLIGGLMSSQIGADATSRSSANTLQAQREAQALNIARYGEAKQLMSPYISQAGASQRQLAYMMGLPDPGAATPQQSDYSGLDQVRADYSVNQAGGYDILGGLESLLDDTWDNIVKGVETGLGSIEEAAESVGGVASDAIDDIFDAPRSLAEDTLGNVRSLAEDTAGNIDSLVRDTGRSVSSLTEDTLGNLSDFGNAPADYFADKLNIPNIPGKAEDWLVGQTKDVGQNLESLGEDALGSLRSLAEDTGRSIESVVNDVLSTGKDAVGSASSTFRRGLGIGGDGSGESIMPQLREAAIGWWNDEHGTNFNTSDEIEAALAQAEAAGITVQQLVGIQEIMQQQAAGRDPAVSQKSYMPPVSTDYMGGGSAQTPTNNLSAAETEGVGAMMQLQAQAANAGITVEELQGVQAQMQAQAREARGVPSLQDFQTAETGMNTLADSRSISNNLGNVTDAYFGGDQAVPQVPLSNNPADIQAWKDAIDRNAANALPADFAQTMTPPTGGGLPLAGDVDQLGGITDTGTYQQPSEFTPVDYTNLPGYERLTGAYDQYADVIGTPSYDAILDPIRKYEEQIAGGAIRAPLDEQQGRIDEFRDLLRSGVDVTQLPGYQNLVAERMEGVNQGAANTGSVYSGRRLAAAGEVGAETGREFYQDYMSREGNLLDRYGVNAGNISTVEQNRLNAQGNIATGVSNLEMDRMNRFADVTGAKAGAEESFYNNYMNLLQAQANPAAATNLASLGVNQAAQQNQQNAQFTANQNANIIGGANYQGGVIADTTGAIASGLDSYMNRPQSPPPYNPPQQPRPQVVTDLNPYVNTDQAAATYGTNMETFV